MLPSDTTISVLHISSTWLHQTQTWLYNTISHLPKKVSTHIACRFTKNLDQFQLDHIHSLSNENWIQKGLFGLQSLILGKPLFRYIYIRHVAKMTKCQIIHSHFGDSAVKDMEICQKLNLPQVVTFYGYDVNKAPKEKPHLLDKYHRLFHTAHAVICEGPHMAKCIQNLGCPKEKLHVQKIGIPLPQFPFSPLPWKSNTPLKIILSGTFTEKKGFPIAIDALAKLKNRIPFMATLVGDGTGNEKELILYKIKKHGLQSHITLTGYVPYTTLYDLAKTHHICLSPSITAKSGDTEGGAPITLLEMAALGLLIVSSTHCDIPTLFTHQHNALLAPENDSDILADHLLWLASHKEQWASLQNNARHLVETEHNVILQAQKQAELYNKLLKNI